MNDFQALSFRLHALSVFRFLLNDPVLKRCLRYLDAGEISEIDRIDTYADFTAALYRQGGDLGDYLYRTVMESENPAVQTKGRQQELPSGMLRALQQELETLTAVSSLSCRELAPGSAEFLPAWENTPHDFQADYLRRLEELPARGYGIFAGHSMFTLLNDGTLRPVHNPDPRRFSDLTGYENERRQVMANTQALLQGLPANNILLYGDAGTGKSCTVKAAVNECCGNGLRLVEVRKNQLAFIPELMERLGENPLKFILFIDDLSFSSGDEQFTDLKAILEGTVSARPDNLVVYATSNRRHMVRQTFSERQGDDVHLGDTLEESASLAARFGLTITFLRPDKKLYALIVEELADKAKLRLSGEALLRAAEVHASRQGGRSPRTARQFVEWQKAREVTGLQ